MGKEKIKILHIQESISFGGVERRRLSLAKHLDKSIFEQKIICTTSRGGIIDEIRANDVEVFEINKLTSPFQLSQHRKVQKIIDSYKPDIIHGAVFEGVIMAAVNGWIKKVPIIIIEETSDPKKRSWKGNLLMKFFSILADKIVGVSQSVTEEYLKNKLNIPDNKIVLINNGVALPRYVSQDEVVFNKLKWGIQENDFVIGTIGRMLYDEQKKFSDLIKGFARFAKDKPNVKLLMVGDGPQRKNYEKLAEELNIKEEVIFTGYQSDIAVFYNLMDVFSLVSAYEAFGLVLAEAMLNELPVVATKVGGMKYIVDDGETGYLISSGETDEFVDKLNRMFFNKSERKTMGIKGMEKARKEFTEDIYVKKIESLYIKMINE